MFDVGLLNKRVVVVAAEFNPQFVGATGTVVRTSSTPGYFDEQVVVKLDTPVQVAGFPDITTEIFLLPEEFEVTSC